MTIMPRDIARRIHAIGPVIDVPATMAIYEPLHEREPYRGVKVARDVKYGPDARQALDLFEPEAAGAARPVLVFVHGGGYVGGIKSAPGSPFYDNIMRWAVKNGMVGVNATYRVAPEHPWPAGAADVAGAMRWVRQHITEHGGDPRRIVLIGHSAGATHVACYAVMPSIHGTDGPGLAGLILISGNYDLTGREPPERYRQYFGNDPSKYAERSPLPGLLKTSIPLMVAYAGLEPPAIAEQNERLVAALAAAKRPARVLKLADHGHISITYAINTKDVELSDAILEFMAGLK